MSPATEPAAIQAAHCSNVLKVRSSDFHGFLLGSSQLPLMPLPSHHPWLLRGEGGWFRDMRKASKRKECKGEMDHRGHHS